jgi:hypothetical protein
MDAVRTALLGAALAAGCTTTATTSFPGGSVVARPQEPAAQPPAPVVPAAASETVAEAANATRQIRPVALVGTDAVITDDEVWQMVRHRQAEFAKLDKDERAAKEAALFRQELRGLVERELVIAELTAKLKKNAPHKWEELKEQVANDVTVQLKRIRKSMGSPSDADFAQILTAQRLTPEGIRRQFERAALKDMYLGNFLREKKREFGLAEVRQYYDDHPDEFVAEDRAKWQDLFLAAGQFASPEACRQAAADLARQARGGADFVALVRQHGHGDSKLRDGEGIGARRGEVRPAELEAAVFALRAGQVSDPLPTDTGYHVVKVLEREVAGRKPFDAAAQQAIRSKLLQRYREGEVRRLIDDLWRKTTVEFVGVP